MIDRIYQELYTRAICVEKLKIFQNHKPLIYVILIHPTPPLYNISNIWIIIKNITFLAKTTNTTKTVTCLKKWWRKPHHTKPQHNYWTVLYMESPRIRKYTFFKRTLYGINIIFLIFLTGKSENLNRFLTFFARSHKGP